MVEYLFGYDTVRMDKIGVYVTFFGKRIGKGHLGSKKKKKKSKLITFCSFASLADYTFKRYKCTAVKLLYYCGSYWNLKYHRISIIQNLDEKIFTDVYMPFKSEKYPHTT